MLLKEFINKDCKEKCRKPVRSGKRNVLGVIKMCNLIAQGILLY